MSNQRYPEEFKIQAVRHCCRYVLEVRKDNIHRDIRWFKSFNVVGHFAAPHQIF